MKLYHASDSRYSDRDMASTFDTIFSCPDETSTISKFQFVLDDILSGDYTIGLHYRRAGRIILSKRSLAEDYAEEYCSSEVLSLVR